jgi:hypothetical protein
MANPTKHDAMKLKKLIRYLMGAKRRATLYQWQDPPGVIRGYTDSDWAGCTRTRRSTSGGVLLYGQHLVHHWSSTQSVVALSSMEAELNALVKGTAEVICLKNMLAECGEETRAYLCTDSSAAHGALHRQGCGKVKHLACRQLWVQDVVAQGVVKILKVPRLENPSDAFTHYWTVAEGQLHLTRIGIFDPDAQVNANRREEIHLSEALLQVPRAVLFQASRSARTSAASAVSASSEGGCCHTPSQATLKPNTLFGYGYRVSPYTGLAQVRSITRVCFYLTC